MTNTQPQPQAGDVLPLPPVSQPDRERPENAPAEFFPEPAWSLPDTGLPRGLVTDLVLKQAFLDGTTSIVRLIHSTKLSFPVIEAVFRSLQRDQQVEIKGLTGHDYEFSLTAKGVLAAEAAFRKNQYVGPAPVPLTSYSYAVRAQASRPRVTREILARTLSDLVVTDQVITDLGAALMTGGAIFLYGPTGNGKTSIAERLPSILPDRVFVPYAVEISGQVLVVYDPHVHKADPDQPADVDPRWLLCHRPFVMVGGEMTAAMLEPHFDEATRFGAAPLQMKANNGIFVIDDFGRQQLSPQDLLNRWIVPLDRRVDYLALGSTLKFEIPFEVVVVFSTNLDPGRLAEEAFLRRIRNKIKIDTITPGIFRQIWERECARRGIEFRSEVVAYACRCCAERTGGHLRACFPRDLMDILCGIAAFERHAPALTQAEIDRAVQIYFTR